ncbi:MAG TPA: hypothetical protein VHZ07_09270 [Bryobacteraceae bacterium]|jgi:hypothetical protein|nr:hypothetical protein [Bryobacteraceae bacterium]
MALCKPLQVAACLFLCAGLTPAQSLNRPAPIASPTETTIVDGGLGAAPAIELPRVESAPASNSAADFSRPFTQMTTASRQSNGLATKLLKIGLGGIVPVPGMFPGAKREESEPPAPGSGKLGLKRFLVHKTYVETTEPEQ